MRTLIQVVNNASVEIDNKIYSKIDYGYLILVGFSKDDDHKVIDRMVDKIIGLRILPDENNKTNLSILDVNGEILSVSQFTLYADTKKGRRPSFVNASGGEQASNLFDYFNSELNKQVSCVKTGVFGAQMKVKLENNGPFTIYLDSNEL
ncbi:TPA: D-tyrosyl-tRNA(Tyr) deacylase [bacterium]|nr:D-tyrosyl-tRNA(Tyr) deacylase [bacterium]